MKNSLQVPRVCGDVFRLLVLPKNPEIFNLELMNHFQKNAKHLLASVSPSCLFCLIIVN